MGTITKCTRGCYKRKFVARGKRAENESGWNNIFAEDESDEDVSGMDNTLPTLFPSTLMIPRAFQENPDRRVELIISQSEKGFGHTGEDTTGHVLWGAACCLAHYLLADHTDKNGRVLSVKDHTVLELGCGSCCVPSLVVSRYMAPRCVYATDMSQSSLKIARLQAAQNPVSPPAMDTLRIESLDWGEVSE